MKLCTYAGLCAGSVKASKKLVSALIGPYKYVGGHHPLQQAAFRDHPLYDFREVLAVSEKRLAKYGDPVVIHKAITTEQRILQKELANSGRTNTMAEQVRISWQAMERAGIPRKEAKSITAQAYWDLKSKGVKEPTNIPWRKK